MLKEIKARIRNDFSTGLLSAVSLPITVCVISILLTNVDRIPKVIPDRCNPLFLLPLPLPGLRGHPDLRLLLPQPSGTNHGYGNWFNAPAVREKSP